MAAAADYLGSDLDDDQSEASEISEEIEVEAAGQSSGDGAGSGSEDGRSGGEANAADHSSDGDAEAGATNLTTAREGQTSGACRLDSTCCAASGQCGMQQAPEHVPACLRHACWTCRRQRRGGDGATRPFQDRRKGRSNRKGVCQGGARGHRRHWRSDSIGEPRATNPLVLRFCSQWQLIY